LECFRPLPEKAIPDGPQARFDFEFPEEIRVAPRGHADSIEMEVIRCRGIRETFDEKECFVSGLPQLRKEFSRHIRRRTVWHTEGPHLPIYDCL